MKHCLIVALFGLSFAAHSSERDSLLNQANIVEYTTKIGALNAARHAMSCAADQVRTLKESLDHLKRETKKQHQKDYSQSTQLQTPRPIDDALAATKESYNKAYDEYMNSCLQWSEYGTRVNSYVEEINRSRTNNKSCWYYLCCGACIDISRDPFEIPYKPRPAEQHLISIAQQHKKTKSSTECQTVSL